MFGLYQDKLQEWRYSSEGRWTTYGLMMFLSWYRLYPLMAIGCEFFWKIRRRHATRQRADNKIPKVKEFISKNTRCFDPEIIDKDSDTCCAICMEDFSQTGPKIVELACNTKHIFHTTCILEWIKKD